MLNVESHLCCRLTRAMQLIPIGCFRRHSRPGTRHRATRIRHVMLNFPALNIISNRCFSPPGIRNLNSFKCDWTERAIKSRVSLAGIRPALPRGEDGEGHHYFRCPVVRCLYSRGSLSIRVLAHTYFGTSCWRLLEVQSY